LNIGFLVDAGCSGIGQAYSLPPVQGLSDSCCRLAFDAGVLYAPVLQSTTRRLADGSTDRNCTPLPLRSQTVHPAALVWLQDFMERVFTLPKVETALDWAVCLAAPAAAVKCRFRFAPDARVLQQSNRCGLS